MAYFSTLSPWQVNRYLAREKWSRRTVSFVYVGSWPSDTTRMPRSSPSGNCTSVDHVSSSISKRRYANSVITAWTPKMIISISNVQMSSGWMPSFTRNLSNTGELSSLVKLFSPCDFRTRSLPWAWRTYFPMTLWAKHTRKTIPGNDSRAVNLLVKYVASLEQFPGERSQEESPHLKASFTAAQVLVRCHQGVDNSSGLGRRIVASRLQEPEALVQRYVAETLHGPSYHVLVKTSRYLFDKFIDSSYCTVSLIRALTSFCLFRILYILAISSSQIASIFPKKLGAIWLNNCSIFSLTSIHSVPWLNNIFRQ